MPVALETVGLCKQFGGIAAVDNVSLRIEQGARHALIGPNGAGKTTVINLLTGVLAPSGGRILLQGQNITTADVHRRVALGLARTFQINQLFLDLTPILEEQPDPQSLYLFPDDAHNNPKGLGIIAKGIADGLYVHGLLKNPGTRTGNSD